MGKKPVMRLLFFSGLIVLFILAMQPWQIHEFKEYIGVLFPSGKIAVEERNLLILIQILMLFVIVPVYILTFVFSWIYRADNPRGNYDPDLVDHKILEIIWWGLPLAATIFISYLTWVKTHELDPYKPISETKKEITIQAIALQWKWLFLYPDENIASVNFIQIPKDTPIRFEITADAPMNSLWIPDLAGQIYAMPSMRTLLHLIANKEGDFRGVSANISGEGFADMYFVTRASSEDEYHKWLGTVKSSQKSLDWSEYAKLAKPGTFSSPETYLLKDKDLFNKIMMKYMHPSE